MRSEHFRIELRTQMQREKTLLSKCEERGSQRESAAKREYAFISCPVLLHNQELGLQYRTAELTCDLTCVWPNM